MPGPNLPSYVQDEVITFQSKVRKLESRNGGLILLAFFMGLFLTVQLSMWATNPEKYWEVDRDADHPIIIFHYQLWNNIRVTRYTWGKNDDGEFGWITIDKNGRPDGGSLEPDYGYDDRNN